MFLVTRPAIRWEFPEVHLLNFAILIATLFCFEFFWRELLAQRGENAFDAKSLRYAWAIGYFLFAYMHFVFHELASVSPDLLVAAVVYFASGMMLRFAGGRMSTVSAAWFGVLLGIGYLAKAAMLPIGLVVLAVMLAVAWKRHRSKGQVTVALLCFVAVSAPFIAALSWNVHRFTFGDSGKINVAWFVNGPRPMNRFYHHWQGGGMPSGRALHPTRKIDNSPEVYEFATPVAGTYPV
jgi:4-amino-4-deoxy-L-arabinose transferase-like glycosyltransferase